MWHYRVFADPAHPHGGKHFALLELDSLADEHWDVLTMQRLAQESNAPITAFVARPGLNPSPTNRSTVRFFAHTGQEKPESDSGALVVAQHTGRTWVDAPGGSLQVTLEDGCCWVAQGDHHILPLLGDAATWLAALGLGTSDLEPGLTVLCAGQPAKHNVVVPVRASVLDAATPDMNALANVLQTHAVNGLVLACFSGSRANLDFRFFAPHKNLPEDNAGAYTLASVCGYQAAHSPSGLRDFLAIQGFAMGRPSGLRARFIARDSVALAVQVGGIVTQEARTREAQP